LEEARKLANADGLALDQLANVALAEKPWALRTDGYFRERGDRGDLAKALGILDRAGASDRPERGDRNSTW
jgi:hypothetical protein